jgi:4-hydroxy-2-oxoheptanedioate aldolase
MNKIRAALAEGRPSFGGWSTMGDSVSAELMGGAGFDWVIVDTQHGSVTGSDLVRVIQALALGGTPAVVRVPWTDEATIMRALDVGATGVIVPMVNSPEDAAAAASAMRYPPDGIRSMGPTRGAFVSTAAANADVVLLVMVETAEALDRVDEIAAVPGVDGIFVGPVDLALSLGLPLDWTGTHPDVLAAMDTIVAAADKAGVFVGTVSSGAAHAKDLVGRGVKFVSLGADVGYLRAGIARDGAVLGELRATSAAGGPGA